MNKEFLEFFTNENIKIDTTNFVANLIIALILCLLIRLIYLRFSTSLSNKHEFSKNFVILGLTTCIVITIVKSSLALSLGLVGALSIVRFRAAIKEPEELVFLFLVIAIGLGAGAGQTNIVIVGTLLSSLIIIIFYKFNKNVQKSELGNLTLSITISRNIVKKDVDILIKLISKYSKYLEVNSVNHSKNQFVINLFFLPLDFSKNTLLNDQILNNFPDANIIISKDHAISL